MAVAFRSVSHQKGCEDEAELTSKRSKHLLIQKITVSHSHQQMELDWDQTEVKDISQLLTRHQMYLFSPITPLCPLASWREREIRCLKRDH